MVDELVRLPDFFFSCDAYESNQRLLARVGRCDFLVVDFPNIPQVVKPLALDLLLPDFVAVHELAHRRASTVP